MKLRKLPFLFFGLIAASLAAGCAPDQPSVKVIDPPKNSSNFDEGNAQAREALEAKNATADPADPQKGPTGAPGATPPKNGEDVAVIETNFGRIILKFFPNKAPNHVANFEKLANKKFYDGTKFHRVIPGFMIQGGDPYSKTGAGPVGTGGPGYTVKAEFNDTKHTRGILSMARSQDPDSAGSQFFIMVAASPQLDGQYSAFGQVVQGMDVVDKIVNLPRDGSDKPTPTEAVMKTVRIVKWPVKN